MVIIDSTIIVALIAASASIISAVLAVIGVRSSNRQSEANLTRDLSRQLEKHQAVTDIKIENLTNEVAKHNSFAQRVPIIEEQVKNLEQDVKELKTAI